MNQSLEFDVRVVDKLTPARPLLESNYLLSEKFKAFGNLLEQPIAPDSTRPDPQCLAGVDKKPKAILPFKKISDILCRPEKIVYNILGSQPYNVRDESFGFQYYNQQQSGGTSLQDTGNGSASCLKFQSRFECGNLLLAYQVSPVSYYLVVKPDYNTTSFCQWFYFEVRNTSKQALKVKFQIINMTKSSSLFSQGMKIVSMSNQDKRWVRSGSNISYTKNNMKRFMTSEYYHTLSWTINISPQEQVVMAYSQPYSFSQLSKDLDVLEQNKYAKRSILTRSLLGNRLDIITISSGLPGCSRNNMVIITARTHPGQTVGSYVMKGLVEFLTSQLPQAQLLREKFVFKLIPMANPDGVIHGNSRCTMGGIDPNRHWTNPTIQSPQVFYLKKFILQNRERLVMYCDLHGHSKKKNIFTYGCNDNSKPMASREIPYILSKLFDPFCFEDCNFKVDKYKAGTARVALWKSLKLPNIFTLESSFCSSQKSNMHLDEDGYKSMGGMLCKAINISFSQHYSQRNESHLYYKQLRSNMINDLEKKKELLSIGMQQCSSSESEQEDRETFHLLKTSIKEEFRLNISEYRGSPVTTRSARNNTTRYYGDLPPYDQLESKKVYKMPDDKRISESRLQRQSKTNRSMLDHRATITQNSQVLQQGDSNHRFKHISKSVIKYQGPLKLNQGLKSQTPRSYIQRKILNFDFAEKLQDVGDGVRSKLRTTRNKVKESETFRDLYDSIAKVVKKDTLVKLMQDKLKSPDNPRQQISYRKRNFNSRLELFFKKMEEKQK